MAKLQVLIIDENPDVLKWLAPEIRKEKYQVLTANSGKEALSQLFIHPSVHIIILSSSIKDIPALDLIHKIKEFVGMPHIIILGTQLKPQVAVELMRAGAGDIVKRPFHELELIVALRQSFDIHTGMEQMLRQWDRNFEEDIELRINRFKELVETKKAKDESLKPSEIALFFPGQDDPSIDLSTHDILDVLKTKTAEQFSDEWNKPVILTVDDELGLLKTLKYTLSTEFEVLQASTGELAYEILKDKSLNITAVLLDIGMPGETGDKWVARYRELNPDLVIVMLTAFENIELIVSCIRAGAYDYLIKPFLNDKLLDKMSAVVSRKLFLDRLAQWTQTKRFRVKKVED